ncbi:MAG TPA: CRISPR-associated endonuclease Cas1 [Thermoanaerobaculia bacterium]|jgi:CRISPR-associated protein Cas1|nr:CRISPR-associated endonuclease Cas1 [Thermoanaerobaculia bacterium]
MATLYLTEQGSILRKTSDRLIVEKHHEVLLEVPCLKVDTILIFGNVQVTTQALAELLDHGIELALLSMSGKLRGQLTPPNPKNIRVRMRQYELAHSESSALDIAKRFVSAKIANSAAVLTRLRRHAAELPLHCIQELNATVPDIETATSLESLLGLEGAAAARYFRALGQVAPSGFSFESRSRRPPRDPLNALLSFGYVLVGKEIQSLLDAMGFDPYIGIYHQVDYGQPSLALDLLEEFRAPLVDRFSLSLLNLRILARDDFHSTPEGGVLLGHDSMKRYFPAYEKELNAPLSLSGGELSFRHLFRRQAERLARTLVEGEPYEPFLLPC